MRTNEPDPQPWQPLGERVKPGPVPTQPEWKPKSDAPHIEVGQDGKLRTNLPLPK